MTLSGGSDDNVIRFQAIVYKVQTLVDNGLRVTLDLPEQAIVEAAQLMELKRNEAVLNISIRWEVSEDRDELDLVLEQLE
jgi:hypothetical protein